MANSPNAPAASGSSIPRKHNNNLRSRNVQDDGTGAVVRPGDRWLLPGECRAADRHQVLPRGRGKHAQRPGRAAVQETRRTAPGRPGRGRRLSQLVAVRRRQGNGGAAAGRRADAGAVPGQVRAVHAQGADLRPAVPLRRHPGGRPLPAQPAGARLADQHAGQGHPRPGLLAQRDEAALRQSPVAGAGRRARAEIPRAGVRRAQRAVPPAPRDLPEDVLRRGLPGLADRRGEWHREHLVELREPEGQRGTEVFHRVQPRRWTTW